MPYRRTEFVENKRQAVRKRIILAARQLVEAGGWKNCTLTKVARDAGVASGSIYTHFAKITELYIEVFCAIADVEVAVIAAIVVSEAPPVERLESSISTFTRRALRGRVKAYAVIGEPVAPEVDVIRQHYHTQFIEQYALVIRDGISSGDFRNQTPLISATCILGAIAQALIAPLAPDAALLPDKGHHIQRDILSFCLSAVR